MHINRLKAHSGRFQTLVHAIFPPECLTCRAELASDDGLCGTCWRDTPFISGDVCALCGTPLSGEVQEGDQCDACLNTARSWSLGRAALLYENRGRQLVLSLKHGDRQELARPAGGWVADRLRGHIPMQTLVLPVPLHWTRQAKRRYNQSALLARSVASHLDLELATDVLKRVRATHSLDDMGRSAREQQLSGAIAVVPRKGHRIAGRPVLLIDDVMTTGVTLSECASACKMAGCGEIFVGVLARVAKNT